MYGNIGKHLRIAGIYATCFNFPFLLALESGDVRCCTKEFLNLVEALIASILIFLCDKTSGTLSFVMLLISAIILINLVTAALVTRRLIRKTVGLAANSPYTLDVAICNHRYSSLPSTSQSWLYRSYSL